MESRKYLTGLILDPQFEQHKTGPFHPESPDRVHILLPLLTGDKIPLRMASRSELALCHTDEYITLVENECHICSSVTPLSTGDVMISPHSWDTTLYATGTILNAIDSIMDGSLHNAFAATRPPGHHATSSCGMGFCLFNHIAIAARYIQTKYHFKKILIVDWDLHHGNGTQEIFYTDPNVFYFSTHQSPLYPGTGFAEEKGICAGLGTTYNIPITPSQQAREEILFAYTTTLPQLMETFQPEFILISCGFDAHYLDPLGQLNLTSEDFFSLTTAVLQLAEKQTKSRSLSILEGGYHIQALAQSAKFHLDCLKMF